MNIEKTNYCVARVKTYTAASISKAERHNERKNESYANMNVDLSRTPMNVHFKDCGDLTYNQKLQQMVDNKQVSLRGLRSDAKLFDEMIVDVNTQYFEDHGGYDYAVRFYEEAYRFAVREYGEANILSAVMHADELNKALSEQYGYPVYHYHMHIVALPVVEKQVLWSKRCKDPALVGTVKEVIHQISHSKKWRSEKKLDENGQPVLRSDGKPVLIPSYSLLQDRFFAHMQNAGYPDFVRGERGSTTEHLSCLQYQIEKDTKRLSEMQAQVQAEEVKYDAVHSVHKTYDEIDNMGKKNLSGKYTVAKEDYEALTALAKSGVVAHAEIQRLQEDVSFFKRRFYEAQSSLHQLQKKFNALKEKCQPYLYALEHLPDLVSKFMDAVKTHIEQRKEKKPQNKNYDRDAR